MKYKSAPVPFIQIEDREYKLHYTISLQKYDLRFAGGHLISFKGRDDVENVIKKGGIRTSDQNAIIYWLLIPDTLQKAKIAGLTNRLVELQKSYTEYCNLSVLLDEELQKQGK